MSKILNIYEPNHKDPQNQEARMSKAAEGGVTIKTEEKAVWYRTMKRASGNWEKAGGKSAP